MKDVFKGGFGCNRLKLASSVEKNNHKEKILTRGFADLGFQCCE